MMKTFSIKDEKNPSGGGQIITIEGNLTLVNSRAIKDELLSTIDSDTAVDKVAVKLSEIDLSGLQLLVALKEQLRLNGIGAKFELEFPADLQCMVERSGIMAAL